MPRSRSPARDEAYQIWTDSGGQIANREIAKRLGIPEKTVGGWKVKDKWIERLNGVLQKAERSTPKRKAGAPKDNRNAVGNIGGGAPPLNSNAVTHGFFRKYFPEGVHDLITDVSTISELDKLWVAIQTQFTAIIHAQRVMFVQDETSHSEFIIVKSLNSDGSEMETKMIQPAWDKEANFLQAQSRAMKTLENLIARYLDLLPTSPSAEEHRLRIEKLRAEVSRLNGDEGEHEDDGFLDALRAEAGGVWTDDDSDET